MPSDDMQAFREVFKRSKYVVFLTGAGVSAESGVPTFRGSGGLWRTYSAPDLATTTAFWRNPSLVWEFYHYRRELVATKQANNAHKAIAECEKRLIAEGRKVVVVTQNVDELHQRAGSRNVLQLHGSLFETKCTQCERVEKNYDNPICSALHGFGAPDPSAQEANIPEELLPRCKHEDCNGLLRPNVVWFGESLDETVLTKAVKALNRCDLCLVVGTSSVVYPAAMFAPQAAARGVPVAEFNLEETPATSDFKFHFRGPCGTTLPPLIAS